MDVSVPHGHLKEQERFRSVLKGFVSFKGIITLRKSPIVKLLQKLPSGK